MGKWDKLDGYLHLCERQNAGDFNVGVGQALSALRKGYSTVFKDNISYLRLDVAKSLTNSSASSLQSCHDSILRLHALEEMESISNTGDAGETVYSGVRSSLERRLDILGGCLADKQYLLGLRRALMELSYVLSFFFFFFFFMAIQ